MKKVILSYFIASLLASVAYAQMQVDKPIQLTGTTGERSITNLEAPVNGTDAVNKNYVDAAVAAGGGSSMPTMMSNEGSAVTLSGAVQYCKNLAEAGFSDWRLPTVDELVYFVGDPGVSTNYLWTKSLASGKENPVNQNYVTLRLSDGKWRNGGEITGLLAARNITGNVASGSPTYVLANTLSPLVSGNIFIPTHINLKGWNNTSSAGMSYWRLNFHFADGSAAYSSEFSYSSTSSANTFIDMQSIPLLTSVTPLTSIDVEIKGSTAGYLTNYNLTVSGYEISRTQADGATLATRCVR